MRCYLQPFLNQNPYCTCFAESINMHKFDLLWRALKTSFHMKLGLRGSRDLDHVELYGTMLRSFRGGVFFFDLKQVPHPYIFRITTILA